MSIRISANGFAEFMISNSTKQRKILYDYKYPDLEGNFRAIYYSEARSTIKAFHNNENNPTLILDEIKNLEGKVNNSVKSGTKTRYRNNIRVLKKYFQSRKNEKFNVINESNIFLVVGSVIINARPDLLVKKRNKEILMKFWFKKNNPDKRFILRLQQIFYEAQEENNLAIGPKGIQFVDIERNAVHSLARKGSRIHKEIVNTAQNIEAIWDSI